MKRKRRKKKKYYFDSDKWDGVLILIQEYYKKDSSSEDEHFTELKTSLGKMLSDMANKIIKYKNLAKPGNLYDVVNECICNCFHLLSQGKFNSERGRSFSWITRIIQNTAVWYHYKNHTDIPFSTFQDKSVIEETDENLMMYLAEYYEKCSYKAPPEDPQQQSVNIVKKKEFRLQPYYQLITHNFEREFIQRVESKTIRDRLEVMVKYFETNFNYDKFDVIIAIALLLYMDNEKNIDNITIRRVKKFIVNEFIKVLKKRKYKFKGKDIREVNRIDVISYINKVFEAKIKPFLLENSIIKETKESRESITSV